MNKLLTCNNKNNNIINNKNNKNKNMNLQQLQSVSWVITELVTGNLTIEIKMN